MMDTAQPYNVPMLFWAISMPVVSLCRSIPTDKTWLSKQLSVSYGVCYHVSSLALKSSTLCGSKLANALSCGGSCFNSSYWSTSIFCHVFSILSLTNVTPALVIGIS